jgi:secreted PhoX family phosphatase
MTDLNRRSFLSYTAGTAMGGFAALQGFGLRGARPLLGRGIATIGEGSYGPLQTTGPDLRLPPGFQYRKFGLAGSLMSDGVATPLAHDGMAAFPLPNGNIRLIRNHEVHRRPRSEEVPDLVYDPEAGGGTTSMEIDPVTREVVRDFLSLSGTAVNCAGGATPWGSWLTCEEIVASPSSARSQGPTRGERWRTRREHGYVFEVPAAAEELIDPVPLRAMGRFVHEAAAVDPATGIVYLTEDRGRAGLYRFLPSRPYRDGEQGDLAAGGELQMLAAEGQLNLNCATGREVGQRLPARWVTIDDPDPPQAAQNGAAVFEQGWDQGGARFSRIEGCFYGDDGIYFSCTDGGDAHLGQIWHYRPDGDDGGELILLFESTSDEVLDSPDNICVSPRGGVLITEDGTTSNFVRGLTPQGRMFDFAENVANPSELAGPTFSPDGDTLFLNIQRPGATYAIWGPWGSGGL